MSGHTIGIIQLKGNMMYIHELGVTGIFFVSVHVLSIKIGDVVWLPIIWLSTKCQETNNLVSTGHHMVLNDRQSPYHKASCKRPQNNWRKAIHKIKNWYNLLNKCKTNTSNNEHKNPLDYRFLAWDRHIKYVAWLNLLVSAQPSI